MAGLPDPGMEIDREHTAPVITDPLFDQHCQARRRSHASDWQRNLGETDVKNGASS